MKRQPRPGFTLVELLVVMGLMASLLGLVLVGVRPNDRSQVRDLLQSLSSATLVARTRAIGNESGAAMIIDSASGVMPGVASNVVLQADNPPYVLAGVSGVPTADLPVSGTTVTFSPTSGDANDLSTGYKLRLFADSTVLATVPQSPWLGLTGVSALTGTLSFRTSAAQGPYNTVIPPLPAAASWLCQIACYPRPLGPAFEPPKRAAIDLRYSGIGDTLSTPYGSLAGKGSIAVSFDRTGSLDAVVQLSSGVEPLEPTTPLYLLVAGAADIQANTSLQSLLSRWLVIIPATGRVSIAANIPVTGTSDADVTAARAYARLGITEGIK